MPSSKADDSAVEKSSKKSTAKSGSKSVCRFSYKNPYLNFLSEFRTLPENKNIPSQKIFKLAGKKWRQMTPEEKQPYIDAAQAAREKDAKDSSTKAHGYKSRREKERNKKLKRNSKGVFSKAHSKQKSCSRCGHRHGSHDRSAQGSSNRGEDKSKSISTSSNHESMSVSGGKNGGNRSEH